MKFKQINDCHSLRSYLFSSPEFIYFSWKTSQFVKHGAAKPATYTVRPSTTFLRNIQYSNLITMCDLFLNKNMLAQTLTFLFATKRTCIFFFREVDFMFLFLALLSRCTACAFPTFLYSFRYYPYPRKSYDVDDSDVNTSTTLTTSSLPCM